MEIILFLIFGFTSLYMKICKKFNKKLFHLQKRYFGGGWKKLEYLKIGNREFKKLNTN